MGKRLPAADRRNAILDAVVPLFANKGFHGVRTREIAQAAGVSEALVFKHFPSKEALYREIWKHIHDRADEKPQRLERFASLAPSTEKLMLGIHLWVEHMAETRDPAANVVPRLMLNSLLEDGEFARVNLDRFRQEWFAPLAEALEAAIEVGDAVLVLKESDPLFWLTHHLTVGLRLLTLPERPVLDYKIPRSDLIAEAVGFVLRGLGVKPEAIERKYDPIELMKWLDI